jgi:hypothetical protein
MVCSALRVLCHIFNSSFLSTSLQTLTVLELSPFPVSGYISIGIASLYFLLESEHQGILLAELHLLLDLSNVIYQRQNWTHHLDQLLFSGICSSD